MRKTVLLLTICVLAPTPAWADCAGEIGALFDGGAWDPFARENRRETTILRKPDGTDTQTSDVLWDGPFRSINCTANGCFMAIGVASWTGPSFDGPWSRSNNTGTHDPEEFVRGTNQRLAASVSDVECLGEVKLGEQTTQLYQFFSKPEPNEYGSWWGGNYSVWVDQAKNRILKIELADGIASWAPEATQDVQVTTIEYDHTIEIPTPE